MTIHLLSNPRNVSTALMYSFAQRRDCDVLDEPFYAYYLQESGEDHPMRDKILSDQSAESKEVLALIGQRHQKSQNLFVKNMAHHVRGMDWTTFGNYHNVLFIRHPREVLASFSKVIDRPSLKDIAIRDQFDLWQYFRVHDMKCTILDASDLLRDPERMLGRLCDELGIAFDPEMLSWPTGPKDYDGVWASAWYRNVHRSTGFVKTGFFGSNPLSDQLEHVATEAMKYYTSLYEARLD